MDLAELPQPVEEAIIEERVSSHFLENLLGLLHELGVGLRRVPKNLEDLAIYEPVYQLLDGFLHLLVALLLLDVLNQIVDFDYAEDSELECLRFEAFLTELKP